MTAGRQVMPDDHSELEPPLPIPNRTVKRYRADDSAETSVKVGYRQAIILKAPENSGAFLFLSRFPFSSLLSFSFSRIHSYKPSTHLSDFSFVFLRIVCARRYRSSKPILGDSLKAITMTLPPSTSGNQATESKQACNASMLLERFDSFPKILRVSIPSAVSTSAQLL